MATPPRSPTEERTLVSKIDKAVQKGAMHKNTGARKKSKASRLAAAHRQASQAADPLLRAHRPPQGEG